MSKNGNNEGSVYKDKQGHWRGQVRIPTADGKVKRKYFYGKTRKEVSDKVNEILRQIKTDTYIEPCKTLFYDWLCTWYETYCNDIRMTTKINYHTYIHRHIKDTIGGYKLCDLTTLLIQNFYNDRAKNGKLDGSGGLSPKTMKNLSRLINIEFKRPDVKAREAIWFQHLKGEGLRIPLAEDVDVHELAERYEFCGREIKNSVKDACVIAAIGKQENVTQSNLIKAAEKTKTESEKVLQADDHTLINKLSPETAAEIQQAMQKKIDQAKTIGVDEMKSTSS